MFQLTNKEKNELVATYVHLKALKYSPHLPHAFTEHGAVMLASILNSKIAIQVNIQVVRVFTKMRQALLAHKDILLKLEKVEQQLLKQDERNEKFEEEIHLIFETMKQLLNGPAAPRKKIGYKQAQKD